MTEPKQRKPREHFVYTTITVRIPVDRKKPKEVADAYAALAELPDMTKLPANAEVTTDAPDFGSREIDAAPVEKVTAVAPLVPPTPDPPSPKPSAEVPDFLDRRVPRHGA